MSVHEGRAWVTEISTRALTAEPELPARLDQGTWRGTDLATHAPDEAYLAGVRGATELIERGELEKIVMARRITGSVDASDDVRVPLARLAERYTCLLYTSASLQLLAWTWPPVWSPPASLR